MADFAKNGFLNSLLPADRKHLEAHASLTTLIHGKQLQEQRARVEHVYFPLSGIISLLAVMKNGTAVESALVSASGAAGIAVGLGIPLAISRAVVQAPGSALRISAAHFLKIAKQSATLVMRVGVHQENLLAQVQQTAACNSVHTAEQRLARWLLQAQDNIADGELIPFTHEFLSNILGVRRSTVTLIAAALQRAGSIRYVRGRIEILDRPALKRTACECYEVIRILSGQGLKPELSRGKGKDTRFVRG
ncbi:MAG: Crp/Fnr family transcriptional regulator [Rhizomicrobium sp.]